MKAVIMAGGEGTRLRPLTSNAPKPMLPVANRPMMEHVIDLLRRHGFDEIVVTVAFLANAIKTYFGDGSEFGVQIMYADEPVPLGTAGSVLQRQGAPRRAVPRDLRRRASPTSTSTKIVAFHDERKAMATIGLVQVENPLEFGIVITHEDGTIERFLEKPTWGQVFSDTINTGIYVLDPAIFDYIDPDRSVDFSSEVFPELLADGKALYGAIAEGYWEDVGTLEAYLRAHKDVLDQRVAPRHPRLPDQRRRLAGRGRRGLARRPGPRAGGDRAGLQRRGRLPPRASTWCSAATSGCWPTSTSSGRWSTTTSTSVRARGCAAPWSGRSTNIRSNVHCDEGVVLGDEVFVGSNAVLGDDVKVYPFKTIEDGAVVNSSHRVGEQGRPEPVRPGGHERAGQRRHHPGAGRQGRHGLRHQPAARAPRSSRRATPAAPARMLKRAMMAGPQRRRGSTCSTSRWRQLPVTRFLVRSPRAGRRPVGPPRRRTTPQSVVVRFFDADRRRHLRGRAAQDRAAVPPGGLPAGPARGDRRHQLPAPGPGGLHRRPRGHDRREGHRGAPLQAGGRLRLRRDVDGDAERAGQAGRRRARREPVRLDRRHAPLRPRRRRANGSPAWCGASGAHLGAVLDPDGERLTLIDDEGHVLTDTESTAGLRRAGVRPPARRHDRPAGQRHAARRAIWPGPRRPACARRSCPPPALADAATEPGVGFAADGQGGFILPGFLPGVRRRRRAS